LTGWERGLKVVSLIEAIRKYSTTTALSEAKAFVESVLAGGEVTLHFHDDAARSLFYEEAHTLGAVMNGEE